MAGKSMKKLLFSVILGISFLGISRSFAAGEPGERITKLLAIARYSGPLTTEQRKEFREWLDEVADEHDSVEEDLARVKYEALLAQGGQPVAAGPAIGEAEDKSEQEDKEGGAKKGQAKPKLTKRQEAVLGLVARGKGVELPAVLEDKIGSYLVGSHVPFEWNVRFAKGQKIKDFDQIGTGPGARIKCFTISPDGQYIALLVDFMKEQSRHELVYEKRVLYVWNMQDRLARRQEINAGHINDIILGPRSLLIYTFFRTGNKSLGVIDLATGRKLWDMSLPENFPASLNNVIRFSPEGDQLIVSGRFGKKSRAGLVFNIATGKEVESIERQVEPNQKSVDYRRVYSADETKRCYRNQNEIIFESEKAGEWVPYDKVAIKGSIESSWLGKIIYSKKDILIPYTLPEMMCLSSQGLRLAVAWNYDQICSIQIYDVFSKTAHLLQEINMGREIGLLNVSKLAISGGLSEPLLEIKDLKFSPSGRHLIAVFLDNYHGKIILKVYDLLQFFDGVDEYEAQEARSRAASKTRQRAWELEQSGAQEY
jgi:hypothetical protein